MNQGILEVTLESVSGIGVPDLPGLYCVVQVGKQKLHSRVISKNTKSAIWNEVLKIPVNGDREAVIHLMKEGFVFHQEVGTVSLNLNAVYKEGNREGTYPLILKNGSQGGISVQLKFEPLLGPSLPVAAKQLNPLSSLDERQSKEIQSPKNELKVDKVQETSSKSTASDHSQNIDPILPALSKSPNPYLISTTTIESNPLDYKLPSCQAGNSYISRKNQK